MILKDDFHVNRFLFRKRINWIQELSPQGLLMTVILMVFLILTCKAPLQKDGAAKSPLIRIGILEHKNVVEFKIAGQANFRTRDRSLMMRNLQAGHWKVETRYARAAKIKYRLVVGTTRDRFKAEEILRFVSDKKLDAQIEKYTRRQKLNLPYFKRTTYQVVLDREFNTKNDALVFQRAIKSKTGSEVIEVATGQAQGVLRFTHLGSKYSFDSSEEVRFNTDNIELLNVDVGSGYHWESQKNRHYAGMLEFVLDVHGAITVINELSLEDYLKGVVPSEMPVSFPFEALKAQAVAARVEAVSKIGLRHPQEPFDLCDDVHCQVFSGKSRQSKSSNDAVESTRGIFMTYRKSIIDAFYSAVCGGHTENNENVWVMDARPYLRGLLDKRGRGSKRLGSSLQKENNVKKWIDSRPDVNCNTVSKKVPSSLNYSKKYFRWQKVYKRKDLEQILRDKTNMDFGQLLNLIPVKRGVSGRLMELLVVGTKKRFKLEKELTIRRALSKNTLFSASFYIVKEGKSKLPERFILKGAGWGHGVGMCQIGAANMALHKKKFDEILTHYYKGVTLDILYN